VMQADVAPRPPDIAPISSDVAPRSSDIGSLPGDIASRSVDTGSLQADRGSWSTDIVALSVGRAPLPGDSVPMSPGILSMSVDSIPLPDDGDRPFDGIDPLRAGSEPMSVDIAPLPMDLSRCPSTSIQCKPAPIVASRLRSEAAGSGPWGPYILTPPGPAPRCARDRRSRPRSSWGGRSPTLLSAAPPRDGRRFRARAHWRRWRSGGR
jgi:hypothetical protein